MKKSLLREAAAQLPSAPRPTSITRSRELLGDEAHDLQDEDIERIRRHAEALASVLVEVFLARGNGR